MTEQNAAVLVVLASKETPRLKDDVDVFRWQCRQQIGVLPTLTMAFNIYDLIAQACVQKARMVLIYKAVEPVSLTDQHWQALLGALPDIRIVSLTDMNDIRELRSGKAG